MPNPIISLFEAANKQPEGTLIVLDIDETIIRCPTHVGSEAWYQDRIRALHQGGVPLREAKLKANDEWEKVHESLNGELAFAETPDLLRKWKGSAMGLTARAPGFARRTVEQLKNLGVVLNGAPGVKKKVVLDAETAYDEGTLYVGPLGDKGRQFARFLGTLEKMPKSVFFADDREEHLESMKRVLVELGIKGATFRVVPQAPGK